MSGSGSDDTDWAGLLNGANSGSLTLNPSVLGTAAGACETLLKTVMGLITAAQGMTPFPTTLSITKNWSISSQTGTQTTNFASLANLFAVFNNKLTDLVTALQNHQQILTDMGDTFNAAARKYKGAEVANASLFSVPSSGTSVDLSSPTPPAATDGEWTTPVYATGVGSGVSADSSISVPPEPSSLFTDLPDFANINDLIQKWDGTIAWVAGQWQVLYRTWSNAVFTFQSTMSNLFGPSTWSGAAASVAQTSVTSYVTAAQTMGTSMQNMYNSIANTVEFLWYVHQNIPTWGDETGYGNGSIQPFTATTTVATTNPMTGEPTSYTTNNTPPTGDLHWTWTNGTLSSVDTWWDTTSSSQGYAGGLAAIVKSIPVITDPNTADSATGNLSGDYNYNSGSGSGSSSGSGSGSDSGGGGGGGGGGNSGSGSGSGSDSTGTGSGGSSGSGSGTGTGSGGGGFSAGGLSSAGFSAGSLGYNSSASSLGLSGLESALSGASGALGTLANMLQNMGSGASGSLGFSGVRGMSGLWGSGSLLGFDTNPAGFGGGTGTGGGGQSPLAASLDESKLFPRAASATSGAMDVPAEGTATRAGLAEPAAGQGGGFPMGGGMGGGQAGQGGQQKERKRAPYLDGKEHLEEAVGEDPLSVRPIIDR
jgi:hypothetical protein